MEVNEVLHTLKEGDKVEINTHNQTFTVTGTMFDGEIVEIEGPRGGEKSLTENVNSGRVRVLNGGDTEGEVTEIHAL